MFSNALTLFPGPLLTSSSSSSNNHKRKEDDNQEQFYQPFLPDKNVDPAWFKQMSDADLLEMRHIYDTDETVQTVLSIRWDAITRGGIVFKRGSKNKNKNKRVKRNNGEKAPAAAEENEAEDDDENIHGNDKLIQTAWRTFLVDVLRHFDIYGFALCYIEQNSYQIGIPKVLDPLMVSARVYYDQLCRLHWLVYPRGPGLQTHVMPDGRPMDANTPMPGIRILVGCAPDVSGSLTSRLKATRAHAHRLATLRRVHLEACQRAADPFMALQTPAEKYDAKNQPQFTMPYGPPSDQDDQGNPVIMSPEEAEQHNRAVMQERALNTGRPIHLTNKITLYPQLYNAHTLLLDKGVEVAKQAVAMDLTALKDAEIEYESRVGALWGIPRSMFAPASTTKASSDENVTTFHQTLDALKQKLIPFLEEIYEVIHGYNNTQIVAEKLRLAKSASSSSSSSSSRKQEQDTDPDVRNALWAQEFALDVARQARVSIALPGIPESVALEGLYMNGSLKYEYYKKEMATMHCIPLGGFEARPKLTRKELWRVKPETDKKEDAVTKAIGDAKVTTIVTETKTNSATGGRSIKKSKELTKSEPVPDKSKSAEKAAIDKRITRGSNNKKRKK